MVELILKDIASDFEEHINCFEVMPQKGWIVNIKDRTFIIEGIEATVEKPEIIVSVAEIGGVSCADKSNHKT